MRVHIFFLIILFGLLSLQCVHGQRSKVSKSRYHHSLPKVKGSKAKTICPVFTNSRHPFHGLGIKLGDPFAIAYKYYANKRFAFALDVGKPASGLYNAYFRDQFNSDIIPDTLASAESSLSYIAHRVRSDVSVEGKVLYQIDVNTLVEGLQLYVGAGWQWRQTEIQYDYEYVSSGRSDPFGSFTHRRVAMGPQIVAGIEYSYFTIPIAAFLEAEYFKDIETDPGWQRFQGGVGLRYIF